MTAFINTILLIANIISFAATVLFAIFGVYEQIMGPADAENLLKKLRIPLNYNQALIIGFICLALMIITYILIDLFHCVDLIIKRSDQSVYFRYF